jgi:hypothetical protein
MPSNEYTREVNITPLGTAYAWDAPPSWIDIEQVGSTNNWKITVSANVGTLPRAWNLIVRHNDGSTTDTINVSQAAATVATPTATPVPPTATPVPPTATPVPPTATPVPPTATPVPPTATPVPPTATPVPPTATPVPPTFTFASGTTSSNRDIMTVNASYKDVAYAITNDGMTFPSIPNAIFGPWINGSNFSGPTATNDPFVFTGVYRFTKMQSGSSDQFVDCTVGGPYGTTEVWYVKMVFVADNDTK